jgi:pimeloyl-ACP methyl ester carboxylesterase
MNPFYFGTGERRLFGIYEPAAPGSAGCRAAVLCPPWGAEYLHAHRTLRQLALRLSAAGFHSLRFDYFGTGDSSGETEEADLAGWEGDIGAAVDELRDMTGAAQVTLIGLRLGATLAARFAAQNANAIDAVVLWDPVLAAGDIAPDLEAAPSLVGEMPDASCQGAEMGGFCVGAAMLRELRSIDFARDVAVLHVRGFVIVTQLPGEPRAVPADLLDASGAALDVEYFASIKPWLEDNATGGVVPVEVIKRIVDWLE